MIEAIAGIVEGAQEVAISVEECRISISVVEDMRELLNSVAKEAGAIESPTESVAAKEGMETVSTEEIQLDSNAEYVKGGHFYETNAEGEIYKKDGELQTSYEDRINQTPREGERGSWSGERGESKYTPNSETEKGAKAAERLAQYGKDGIEYKNGIPDFSDCAEESVEIDMTENRLSNPSEGIVGNFEKADTECSKKWNAEQKDGRTDWTARQVEIYRHENRMSWHECPDQKTCQLVSQDIHGYFGHSGGVSECRRSVVQDSVGGGFDV